MYTVSNLPAVALDDVTCGMCFTSGFAKGMHFQGENFNACQSCWVLLFKGMENPLFTWQQLKAFRLLRDGLAIRSIEKKNVVPPVEVKAVPAVAEREYTLMRSIFDSWASSPSPSPPRSVSTTKTECATPKVSIKEKKPAKRESAKRTRTRTSKPRKAKLRKTASLPLAKKQA